VSASSLSPSFSKSGTATPAEPKERRVSWVKLAERLQGYVGTLEWVTVAIVTVVTVALHVRFVMYVGGLWRDEANSVQLSTLPSLTQVWQNLDYDSFPILFFVLLRTWTSVFGADNDAALRLLGLIIGLIALGVLFLNARTFRTHLPVLSIALIGLNPMLIRYGDSSRAYGLGMVLILLTFRSVWRLADTSSPLTFRKILLATILAVSSVQCLYYNSVLLFAIGSGAIVVASLARDWRRAAIVMFIGILSACSLLPYVPMMRRMREWTFLVSYPVDLPWLWRRASEVLGSPDPLSVWLWASLLIGGLGVVVIHRAMHWRQVGQKESALTAPILFATITLVVAIPAYAVFLRALGYYTQPWYYITLAILVAFALDVVFGAWPSKTTALQVSLRAVRLFAAFALLGLASLPAWDEMPTRHTNVDLVAARLQSQAIKGDVIVATHWQYAVSLYRYYHGPATVITLPFVEDHRFHRYDLALQQMQSDYPLEPAFSRIREALQSGHRAFFVGALRFPKAGELPPGLSLGYRDANGNRHGGNYDVVWPISAGYFVQSHATNCVQIPVPVPNRAGVQRYEYLALSMAEGWR
jgi:uncharacterized membrane protein